MHVVCALILHPLSFRTSPGKDLNNVRSLSCVVHDESNTGSSKLLQQHVRLMAVAFPPDITSSWAMSLTMSLEGTLGCVSMVHGLNYNSHPMPTLLWGYLEPSWPRVSQAGTHGVEGTTVTSRKELTRCPHQLCTYLFDREQLLPFRFSSRLAAAVGAVWLRKHHLAPLCWGICVTYSTYDAFSSHNTFDFRVYT